MFLVIRLKRVLNFLIILIVLFSIYGLGQYVETIASPVTNKVVVIDAGHGGFDPGAVGTTGTLEKDINLEIALKLQRLLEESGTTTFLTRAKDEGLGSNKRADMFARKEIRDINNADVFLSIHLNSYPSGGCSGAQVFYARDTESRKLATNIQESLKKNVNLANDRQAKELTNVYLLKDIKIPSTIVECGFLSNSEEEKLLQDEKYQSKIAMSIYLGINEYLDIHM